MAQRPVAQVHWVHKQRFPGLTGHKICRTDGWWLMGQHCVAKTQLIHLFEELAAPVIRKVRVLCYEFTDVTLTWGDGQWVAHKDILAGISPKTSAPTLMFQLYGSYSDVQKTARVEEFRWQDKDLFKHMSFLCKWNYLYRNILLSDNPLFTNCALRSALLWYLISWNRHQWANISYCGFTT